MREFVLVIMVILVIAIIYLDQRLTAKRISKQEEDCSVEYEAVDKVATVEKPVVKIVRKRKVKREISVGREEQRIREESGGEEPQQ